MKNLTEEELAELAIKNFEEISKNLSINKLLLIILVIEAVLFFVDIISSTSYLLFAVPCWIIYMIHYFRYRKSCNVIEDIVEELKNR